MARLAGCLSGDAAPPTFAIASAQFDPEHPLRPRPEVLWHGSGGDTGLATEGPGGLHAEQHFVYHRPIRVGDILTCASRPGQEWAKQGRSGRLRFREQITEFRDEAGELAVTARSAPVTGTGWPMSSGCSAWPSRKPTAAPEPGSPNSAS